MPIDKTITNQPPIGGSGECSNSKLDFNSLDNIDMNKFNQSELYLLSLSTSDEPLDPPENDVTPNVIKSGHKPTCGIFTSSNTPRRIFAFSHRRRLSDSDSDNDDVETVAENKSILKSVKKLIAGGDMAVPAAELPALSVDDRPRRKRKPENENEFEGLGVINVQGDVIHLKYLAREGDGLFDAELKKMTEGMVVEEEFLGVIKSFEGLWSSNRRRRKFVDAGFIVKVLPKNWKILLSLRPRAKQPALYCRKFISPSNESFKSCKEVALYLQSMFVANNVNRPEEGAIVLVEPNCKVDLESVARVHGSSIHTSNTDILGTDHFMGSSMSVVGSESPMQKCNGNNNQMLVVDTLNRKLPAPRGVLRIREPKNQLPNSETRKNVENKDTRPKCIELKYIPIYGEGSSSGGPKNNSEMNGNLKTRCFLCLAEFIRKPVDPDTIPGSYGFICPKCKDISSTWLSTQRANK